MPDMEQVAVVGLVIALAFPLLGALLSALGLARLALMAGPIWAAPALASLVVVGEQSGRVPTMLMEARFGLDPTSMAFLAVCAVVWSMASVYAAAIMRGDGNLRRFGVFFFGAMAGNFVLIGALDMISFMSGFALMSYAAYGLVAHAMSVSSWRAGRVYLVLTVAAELALWAGAVLAWSIADTWELAEIRHALATSEGVAPLAIALIFGAFGVKAGLVPLHIWLPLAHPAAPTAASAVLSAAMIKAGVLGWLRFLPLGEIELPTLGASAVTLGALGTFGAVVVGLMQRKPKTILAYSSVSQMGYVALLIGIAARWPSIYPTTLLAIVVFVVHHGLAKGALFLSVDAAPRLASSGSRVRTSISSALVLLPALALCGAPLTSGALAKYALKSVSHLEQVRLPTALLNVWLVAGALATGVLMARFLIVVWRARSTRDTETLPGAGLLAWIVLATGSFWALAILPLTLPAKWFGSIQTTTAMWSALWPLMVVAGLAWAALGPPGAVLHRGVGRVEPGDLLGPAVVLSLYVSRRTRRLSAFLERHWTRGVARLDDRVDRIILRVKATPGTRYQLWARWLSGEWLALALALTFAAAIWLNV
ncbi:NADH/ubiquinone/plastoquinone (complex I) [Lujinxingia sediminis]|uniref:NADH/ubiquinone/plastoquinone (Complex I) n=2 Tax=Lujinxingia sediminis TaxID=2480984 RepID=A0ABY0CX22_9DELT|nr:NADH/ubiquinone/plastoquinone (complex I) [Lujinxingia sediminis]